MGIPNSSDFGQLIVSAISEFRKRYTDFDEAYESYTQEYGADIIAANEPLNLSKTVDPAVLILGRNTSLHYSDTMKELSGSLGTKRLTPGTSIIGRRHPQDSKLVLWSNEDQQEIGEYNPRVGIIPSRIHGAFVVGDDVVFYTDLCSSSGTVIIGDVPGTGQTIRVYDPGSGERPDVKIERICMNRKI